MDTEARAHSESITINASPEAIYDLVSDVTRTGEWSPECQECWWDEGAGPEVGSWFTGRNVTPERTWETRSQVTAAERGKEFAWAVGEDYVRWGYRLEPADAGSTLLTETWEFTPAGVAFFERRFGDKASVAAEGRRKAAHAGIPETLAAIKRIAESASA